MLKLEYGKGNLCHGLNEKDGKMIISIYKILSDKYNVGDDIEDNEKLEKLVEISSDNIRSLVILSKNIRHAIEILSTMQDKNNDIV